MTKQLIVASWDGSGKITGYNNAPNFAAAGPMWSAMQSEGYTGAFIVDWPDGFDTTLWKVNATGNGVEINQAAVDAVAAAAAAKTAEKSRVDTIEADTLASTVVTRINTWTNQQFKDEVDTVFSSFTVAQRNFIKGLTLAIVIIARRWVKGV